MSEYLSISVGESDEAKNMLGPENLDWVKITKIKYLPGKVLVAAEDIRLARFWKR